MSQFIDIYDAINYLKCRKGTRSQYFPYFCILHHIVAYLVLRGLNHFVQLTFYDQGKWCDPSQHLDTYRTLIGIENT